VQPCSAALEKPPFFGNVNEITQVPSSTLPIHTYEAYLKRVKSWLSAQTPCISMRERRCLRASTDEAKETKLTNKDCSRHRRLLRQGRATALALADAGAHVIVHYGGNAEETKLLVDQIRAAAGRADAVAADLATPDGAHTLAAQVHDLVGDHLDISVANAIEDMTVQDLDSSSPSTFDHLTSLFSSCCQS
jgi:hypothetical protein